MHAPIAEPVRSDGQSRHEPLVVLIRVEWSPDMVWNVVASHNGSTGDRQWYVSGLGHPCRWSEILDKLGVTPLTDGWDPPFTVQVTQLTT